MKKKARSRASKAAKGGKSGAAGRKAALLRAQAAPRRSAAPKLAVKATGPDDAKSAVRRLRQELAKARAEIEQLKATAETDFLLDILNRRGFERELARSIAFLKRQRERLSKCL